MMVDDIAKIAIPRDLLEAIGELAMAIKPHYMDAGHRKRIASAIGVLVEHIIASNHLKGSDNG